MASCGVSGRPAWSRRWRCCRARVGRGEGGRERMRSRREHGAGRGAVGERARHARAGVQLRRAERGALRDRGGRRPGNRRRRAGRRRRRAVLRERQRLPADRDGAGARDVDELTLTSNCAVPLPEPPVDHSVTQDRGVFHSSTCRPRRWRHQPNRPRQLAGTCADVALSVNAQGAPLVKVNGFDGLLTASPSGPTALTLGPRGCRLGRGQPVTAEEKS